MRDWKRIVVTKAVGTAILSAAITVPMIMWGMDRHINGIKSIVAQIQKQNNDQQKSWENQLVECGK